MTIEEFKQLRKNDIIIGIRDGVPGWGVYKAGKTSIPKFLIIEVGTLLILVREMHTKNTNPLTIARSCASLYSKVGHYTVNRVNLIEID